MGALPAYSERRGRAHRHRAAARADDLPKFELYIGEQYYGCICKEFTFFTPRFTLECSDWEVNGSFMEWDYTIDSASRGCIASITKELFHWTDTYVIDVYDPKDALGALMVVLAIDAEKCSRNN